VTVFRIFILGVYSVKEVRFFVPLLQLGAASSSALAADE
jgi:hypothetical protein